MSENPFYTLPLYSKYYPYCIIAYMKEEMVDTTYGDVFIKFSISFIRIPSLFSYDNLSIFDRTCRSFCYLDCFSIFIGK
ncbi:hypothetical protein COK71_10860 [Bacillus cereus]|nr:hypothetical protein COK71_10860 [Bacillus cereus]